MLADAVVGGVLGVRQPEQADDEEPKELLGEEVVADAAVRPELFAMVGEVISGGDDSFDPLVGVDDDEVEERLSGEVDAVPDSFGVLDPLAVCSAVLVEGVERGAGVYDTRPGTPIR